LDEDGCPIDNSYVKKNNIVKMVFFEGQAIDYNTFDEIRRKAFLDNKVLLYL
jgi:hypothetical protein